MESKKYHTIDPLIMQTLHLNERRMKRILDILHGNGEDYDAKMSKPSKNKSLSKNSAYFLQDHNQFKNQKQLNRQFSPKKRGSSVSALGLPIRDLMFNDQQDKVLHQSIVRTQNRNGRIPAISLGKKKLVKKYEENNKEQQILPIKNPDSQRNQLFRNYGQHKSARPSKSLEINPKDIYRLQIEALVSKPTDIQNLEDSELIMKRLKKRYQHLKKFDRAYYSKLNHNDFLLV